MRKFLVGLLLFIGFCAAAQNTYNNEWIDFGKTYFRFRIAKDGLYRISGATLSAAGLGTVSAQHFQLWRNGVQVPIYTSIASGSLGATDYIEFFGKMNDGKADRELYRDPNTHLNDKWSLISDSSAYFLTVNAAGNNRRLENTANNVAGNSLPAEPYFLYTAGVYFKSKVNRGLFYVVGTEHLFSSAYDKGEGWTSADISPNGALSENIPNLFPATIGPNPKINAAVSGNAYSSRRYKIVVNGDSVLGSPVPYLNDAVDTGSFNLSLLSSGNADLAILNLTDNCGTSSCPPDKMVVHKVEITYPRQFNFGNSTNFEFNLPASASGNFLEITGFQHGGVSPVLFDLTNGKRYTGEISGSIVRFVLLPSSNQRDLVLVSYVGSNIAMVSSLQARNFTNYKLVQNQASYLIISNPLLFNGANGSNPVEEYRAYRASAPGGGHNARIYLEEELTDQFGFGIRKNPAGIRNFVRFVHQNFTITPKFVFIIGRGVHYLHQKNIEATGNSSQKTNLEKLNLVTTYGWPASDMLLAADKGRASPLIPIGRLTAISPEEVSIYLKKIKDYEQAQRSTSPAIGDKAWMKNIAHIAGAGELNLAESLISYLNTYKRVIEDTLYGAKVTTFAKTSTNLVQQLSDQDLTNLFNQGLSLLTYYGHSSPTTLEFNLDDPANYNNQGKYPMFFALGCNAGNTFDFNESRFITRNYLSDKYVLAPERGSINFVASSHFGIVHYLDIWNIRAYRNMATSQYRASVGEIMKKTIEDVNLSYGDDFFARCNAEETILNGDPAVTLNQAAKPDYVITDTMLRITPSFVSVAEQSFRVKASMLNLGKAVSGKIVVEIKREFPDKTVKVLRRDTLQGIKYVDSVNIVIPIDPITDKGSNKITVSVDQDNDVDEIFETNNVATKEIFIFEDEARPVYPNPFSIVNQANITLKASTANPFSESKQYRMEIDTTELFNSALKTSSTVTAKGGLIEFNPGISFTNGTVYYWRVAAVPVSGVNYTWNTSSFVYMNNMEVGFNQSHYYQHLKSEASGQYLDPASRTWSAFPVNNGLTIKNGVWSIAAFQEADLVVLVNGASYIRNTCNYGIIFNVFDKNTFKPWKNQVVGGQGLYNSLIPDCGESRMYNFEFNNDTSGRRKAMEFLRSVPDGNYVVIRNQPRPNAAQNQYVSQWQADDAIYGANNTLYSELKRNGVSIIDSFYRLRTFGAVYKKGSTQYPVAQSASTSEFDVMTFNTTAPSSDSLSSLVSPTFGPAKQWKMAYWDGTADAGDQASLSVIGVKTDGREDTLFSKIDVTLGSFDISSVNANVYPNVKLHLKNTDNLNYSPYQLKHWRLTYVPVPEGSISPNLLFTMKDTLEVGEPLEVKIGFKNISDNAFGDSLKIKVIVTDRNNAQHVIAVQKHKPITPNELLAVQFSVDTRQLVGLNTMFIDINPDSDQPEQFHFNNFAFRNFYVRGDTLNPLLDVTFDNVHILNDDIVSSKPNILIKIMDEAKWMLINDPSVVTVQVRYPDDRGNLSSNSLVRTFTMAGGSDTLKFIPATNAPNSDNAAKLEFKPYFPQDGRYELLVSGKDMSNNQAGAMQHRVSFQVINKAMISNMLNYPNPFTTSTAFVFTLTGAEVPQNLRIQVLTVTGKIVREITKEELGPLHIGRNITEFKWDGTDQYGQKLANGVYLYRVVTNLNGKSLEKYTAPDESTDKFFNKGYGKMYLMR